MKIIILILLSLLSLQVKAENGCYGDLGAGTLESIRVKQTATTELFGHYLEVHLTSTIKINDEFLLMGLGCSHSGFHVEWKRLGVLDSSTDSINIYQTYYRHYFF